MARCSRRDFLTALAATPLIARSASRLSFSSRTAQPAFPFRIRTITAGVPLSSAADLRPVQTALGALKRARMVFTEQGYEVQTIRITTPPIVAGITAAARRTTLAALADLDDLADSEGASVSIGPVSLTEHADTSLPEWITELISSTRRISVSLAVASSTPYAHASLVAAQAMSALAQATPGGIGNFRFAAAAAIPAGTPFFPVGYHRGPAALALGLESASLVETALTASQNTADATRKLQRLLNESLAPLERTMVGLARREGRAYLGIDTSPAPGMDRSIGAAIESLLHAPFGSSSTLAICAAVTQALQALTVRTCGYSGLMLPVLEDPVLARRADEGWFGIQELLLYSSVCGTGLDVIPVPGDTEVETLAKVVFDVAALSARWKKPLSARLFPVPGKSAGEMTEFSDPLLTNCKVFTVT